jgi:hypothetical protein
VTILCAFQSRAQLLARWGVHDTATILNNTGAVMVFGGTRDRDDLQFWSTLTGERDEPITTTDLHGRVASRTVRRVPVLQPAQLANLPAGRVVVIRRGLPPVIGLAPMAWRRRDVRALAFRRRHPMLGERLAAATGVGAARWERLTGPVRAGVAAVLGAVAGWWARVGAWWPTVPDRLGWPLGPDQPPPEPDPDPLLDGWADGTPGAPGAVPPADRPRMNGMPVGRWTR